MKQEICPKCQGEVYAEHGFDDKWIIRCSHCNYQTNKHDSWKKARIEWDKMKENK